MRPMGHPGWLRTRASGVRLGLIRRLGGIPVAAAPPKRELFPVETTIPMPDASLFHYGLPQGQQDVRPNRFHVVALTTMGRLNMAGLRPGHHVLDVGCGVGRTARYLCDYLGDGRYEGFDVNEEAMRWCEANITAAHPNFRFRCTPLFSTQYNPDPALPTAAEFTFPYADDTFDFAIAQSVFTHLVPDDTRNYLHEIARVLRPGGISYLTWILFNDDPGAYSKPTRKPLHRDPSGTFAVRDPDVPEAAIGYSETFVREAYASSGLTIVEPVHPGFTGFQDVIVAVK
jgi:SAM-dependent methyltransferase